MKILQINLCVNCFSTGKIAEQIGSVAIDNGIESHIVYSFLKKDNGIDCATMSRSNVYRVYNKYSEALHKIISKFFGLQGFGSVFTTLKLIRLIKRINPDIIHLHNIHDNNYNYPILFSYIGKCQKPLVWTQHDCWAFTGGCFHFDFIGCEEWKKSCAHCKYKQSKYQLLTNSKLNLIAKKRYTKKIADLHLVAVSKWLKSKIDQSILKGHNSLVIYNGIDTSVFKPLPVPSYISDLTSNKKIVLGVASNWDYRKGLNDYKELAEVLDTDYIIVLIGLKEPQRSNLPKNIIGHGLTKNQQELCEWYSAALCTLNLSYEETFGLTTVEGFSCGTPGIVYNKTASPELITNETGFVVEVKDYNNICKAIYTLSKNGKSYYSQNCINRAHEVYDKNKNFYKYIDLYKRILSDKEERI